MENTPKPQQADESNRPVGQARPSISEAESLEQLQEGPRPPVHLGLPSLSLDKQRDRLVWGPGLASLLSAHTHKFFVASLPGLGSAEEKQSRLPGLGTLSHCVKVETGEAEPRGGPLGGGVP